MANSCDDVTKALSALGAKIDKLNQCCEQNKNRIADLDRRLKNLERGNSPNNQKPQNLNDIYNRLAKIEAYINALDGTGNTLKEGLEQIKNLFLGG